ncbi:MAG: nucleoside deaminase [Pirellulales bacterium]|nr:nucleoside deaminase [Pirellulales bacterium]
MTSSPPEEIDGPEKSHRKADHPRFPALQIELPHWIEAHLPTADHICETLEERMQLAVDLSRWNVEHGTGGPFGSCIFDMQTKKLLAPGVNIVVSSRWSGGHGEMVAYAVGQQLVGSHNLGGPGMPGYELVTSTEPCSMCFGATPWTGIRRLVCGAREEDAQAIGFDEGPKPENWVQALKSRGIEVVQDVLRDQAKAVLLAYVLGGGNIYNGRSGGEVES